MSIPDTQKDMLYGLEQRAVKHHVVDVEFGAVLHEDMELLDITLDGAPGSEAAFVGGATYAQFRRVHADARPVLRELYPFGGSLQVLGRIDVVFQRKADISVALCLEYDRIDGGKIHVMHKGRSHKRPSVAVVC